jgi:hypothetical protein
MLTSYEGNVLFIIKRYCKHRHRRPRRTSVLLIFLEILSQKPYDQNTYIFTKLSFIYCYFHPLKLSILCMTISYIRKLGLSLIDKKRGFVSSFIYTKIIIIMINRTFPSYEVNIVIHIQSHILQHNYITSVFH